MLGFGFLMLLIVALHKNLISEGEDAMMQAEVDAMGEAEGNFMQAGDSGSDDGGGNNATSLQNIVLVLIDDQGYNDMGKASTDLSVSRLALRVCPPRAHARACCVCNRS